LPGTGKPQPMHYPYRFDVLSRADRNGC
jgi:hypothetical protein